MTPELLAAWRATEYRFVAGDRLLVMRVGQPQPDVDALLAAHDSAGLAFISNFNPRGERYPDKANGQRSEALQNWLLRRGLLYWLGLGVPAADSDWAPETSFAVVGLSREDAQRVAEECEQRGFVWHPRGECTELVVLDSPRVQPTAPAPR
ncbi:MAG: DUF3293 domain-containing protein [Oceanococcaceae bacterium]